MVQSENHRRKVLGLAPSSTVLRQRVRAEAPGSPRRPPNMTLGNRRHSHSLHPAEDGTTWTEMSTGSGQSSLVTLEGGRELTQTRPAFLRGGI